MTKLYKPITALLAGLMVLLACAPAFAAPTEYSNNNATVNVGQTIGLVSYWNNAENGTIDLGTVYATNNANYWLGSATPGTNLELNDTSNVAINASTKLDQPFTSSTHTIPNSNFLYQFNSAGGYTAFSSATNTPVVNNWAAPGDGLTSRAPVDLQLKVPFGQTSGTYTTTVRWYAEAA